MARPELTGVEKLVLELASRERWPYALLDANLKFVVGKPAAAGWRKVGFDVKQSGQQRELSVRWPKGSTGTALKLAGKGWLVLGVFGKTARGPRLGELELITGLLNERNRLSENLTAKSRTLEAVLHLGYALSSFKDIRELVASQMVPELVQLLNADRGSVFLIDHERRELHSVIALGVEFKEIRMPMDRGLAGHVAKTGEVVNVPDAHLDSRFNPEIDRQTGYRTKSVLAAPMRDSAGNRIGVIQVINKVGAEVFSREDEELLNAFASEAGIAIVNARMVEEQRALFESFISSMASALDARDPMTAGHSERVTEYALGIARAMGMGPQARARVRIAGMLHDLGKIGTPDAVLKKPGALSEEEYAIIKQHAAHTRSIVNNLRLPAELVGVAEEASGHHEKLDGSGYPDGLRGEEIPLLARVIAVADVFDAVTSERYYRRAMPVETALELVRQGSGIHFDPKCVDAFLRYFRKELHKHFQDGKAPAA